MVTEAQVWDWLAEVPDPEIPVVSLVDLGIIRAVTIEPDGVSVSVTPTYSGCPATAVIEIDIRNALMDRGLDQVTIDRQLTPVWTTDWITQSGREKLRAYGIAPPIDRTAATGVRVAGMLGNLVVPCPSCGSNRTEKISQFGSTPCKAAYRCKDCLEPFDYFKCI